MNNFFTQLLLFLFAFFPIITAGGFYFWLRWRDKNKVIKRTTLVPEYTPPQGLTPSQMGVLLDNKLDPFDLSADLYDLILQGCIHLNHHKVTLVWNPLQISQLSAPYQELISLIFDGQTKREADLKKLNEFSNQRLRKYADYLYDEFSDQKIYPISPTKQRNEYFALAYAFFTLGFILLMYALYINFKYSYQLNVQSFTFPSLYILGGFGIALASEKVARKTQKGEDLFARINGFKYYLKTAEEDRIQYVIKEEPETYLKILPYAYLFGSIKRWQTPETLKYLNKNLFKNLNPELNDFDEVFTKKNSLIWFLQFTLFFIKTFFLGIINFIILKRPELKKYILPSWLLQVELKVRKYKTEDSQNIPKLIHDVTKIPSNFQPPTLPSDPKELDNHIQTNLQKGGEFLVGIWKEQVVAIGSYIKISPTTAKIETIMVHPQYQRRGFGLTLLRYIVNSAKRKKYKNLQVFTPKNHRPAIRFYKKNGFKPQPALETATHVLLQK